jgi:hypothetical protein
VSCETIGIEGAVPEQGGCFWGSRVTVKPLPAMGVSAQALNCLIAAPIPALAFYRSSVLVRVPRPEGFAIHKLIKADRRKAGPDRGKARKDRGQAAFLVSVLS